MTTDVLAVYCPECEARHGEPCKGVNGPRKRPHSLRNELAGPGRRFVVIDDDGTVAGFLALGELSRGETFKDGGSKEGSSVVGSSNACVNTEGPGTNSDSSAYLEDLLADAIQEAWACWVQLRQPRRTSLPAGTEKQLRRALKAGYSVEQLSTMMQALLASSWHQERDLHRLSTIFATKPGGPTFEDQLDTWLARGEQLASSPGAVSASDIAYDAISAAKATIHQTWGRDGSSATQMRDAALAELERRGIRVETDGHGRPFFTS